MLLYLTNYLAQFDSGFNVFNYLTMRAIMGALTALAISFIIGPRMIKRLQFNQLGQPVRELSLGERMKLELWLEGISAEIVQGIPQSGA